MCDWVTATASEQLSALHAGKISSVELVSKTIERSQSVDPVVNPIALELYEPALEAARKADQHFVDGTAGALCGLPVSVKDSQWLANYPCMNGSLSLSEFIPEQTCQAIERLQNAGAVIFAKTTCPEYSLSGTTNSLAYGATLNPWDLTRTPGGSSGGAAAAIAAGLGSLSLGGDGGGSIRIPSAFCGIVGFKPSFGVVPRSPGFSTWESLVAYGPMCRSVADARLMFEVMANPQSSPVPSGETRLSGLKIMVSEDLGFAPVDQDIRQLFRKLVADIEHVFPGLQHGNPGLKSSVKTWATLATSDMWQKKGDNSSNSYADSEGMGYYAKGFIEFGRRIKQEDIVRANRKAASVGNLYRDWLNRHDAQILITPTLGSEAFSNDLVAPAFIGGHAITYPWLDWAGLLYDANLAGFPACSIPMGVGDEGLPVGLQIQGLPGTDQLVLDVAEQLERIISWQHKIAPDFAGDIHMPATLKSDRHAHLQEHVTDSVPSLSESAAP